MLESLIGAFGRDVIPIELPIGSEKNLTGVVDLVRMKAYTYELGGNGKGKETRDSGQHAGAVQEAHEKLVELVAEGDDKLMEKFFEAGTLRRRRPDSGAAQRHPRRPDFPGDLQFRAGQHRGRPVMDFIVDYTPAPSEHEWVQGERGGNGDAPKRHEADTEPVSLYVFKTVSDPFAGRISYFKVFSGVLKNEAAVQNFEQGTRRNFRTFRSCKARRRCR